MTSARLLDRRSFLAGAAAAVVAHPAASATPRRIAIWDDALPAAALAATGTAPYRAFHEVLRRVGFGEARNVAVAAIGCEAHEAPPEQTAAAIVAAAPDVIVAGTSSAAFWLAAMTREIPVVGLDLRDPVSAGLVRTLARPGGNVTGVIADRGAAQTILALQLLGACVPGGRLALIRTPDMAARARDGVEDAVIDDPRNGEALRALLDRLAARQVGALCIANVPGLRAAAADVVAAINGRPWPAIYPDRLFVAAGGLMSLGASSIQSQRLGAVCVARILAGERPGDLPVRQAVLECVVNLRTAGALGVPLPPAVLNRAEKLA